MTLWRWKGEIIYNAQKHDAPSLEGEGHGPRPPVPHRPAVQPDHRVHVAVTRRRPEGGGAKIIFCSFPNI